MQTIEAMEAMVSGKEKTMTIRVEVDGVATTHKEFQIPEELGRPYAIAYDAGISALGLKLSQGIYDKLIEASGEATAENFLAKSMLNAASDS